MGLRKLTFPTVEVQTSGGTLAVRGLSLDHVMSVFYRHQAQVSALFVGMMGKVRSGGEVEGRDIASLALLLIDTAPTVAAEIIALASGSDPTDAEGFAGDVAIARLLSIAEQLEALEKIGALTFSSDMPPGKVLALVMQAMQAGISAAPSLPDPQA